MARARPFRATVFLPGHDESGRSPVVRKVATTTQEALDASLDRYKAEGYRVKSYEVLPLPLGLDDTEGVDAG